MRCYECALDKRTEPAVAVCGACGAGLCLEHLRDTPHQESGPHRCPSREPSEEHEDTLGRVVQRERKRKRA